MERHHWSRSSSSETNTIFESIVTGFSSLSKRRRDVSPMPFEIRLRKTVQVLARLICVPSALKDEAFDASLCELGRIFDVREAQFAVAPSPDRNSGRAASSYAPWTFVQAPCASGVELTVRPHNGTGRDGRLQFQYDGPKREWLASDITLIKASASLFKAFLTSMSARPQDAASFHVTHDSYVPDSLSGETLRNAIVRILSMAERHGDLTTPLSVFSPDGRVLYPTLGPLQAVLRQPSSAETLAEAARDGTTRVNLDGGLTLQLEWFRDAGGAVVGGFGWPDTAPSNTNARYQQRIRAERALVEASKLLVAGSDVCDYDALLRIVGEATAARYAYLVVVSPADLAGRQVGEDVSWSYGQPQKIHPDTYTQYEWFAPWNGPRNASDGDVGQTFAVPILSSDDQLFGYIGIEYGNDYVPYRDEDARVLSVLGDMLCTYLQRQISEMALRRSEQRYRHFVDTTSEAIWRVEVTPPVDVSGSVAEQIDALFENGVIVECNRAMADLVDVPADELRGSSLKALVDTFGVELIRDLIDACFRLRQQEYVVPGPRRRYFVVNTVGVQSGTQVSGVWGSITEVTDRVELERRMVASLEQQQQSIGRDLHDRVGQHLAGTRMLAQNLAERLADNDAQGGEKSIRKIIEYVHEATLHVNELQRGVMPVQVERDGLAQALTELSSGTDARNPVACTFVHDGMTDVEHPELKLQMYRIAQEATRNAVTHASPTCVEITLQKRGPDEIVLMVDDDGTGFDIDAEESKDVSFGLHSMRYRARSIGASLDIWSEMGEGTTVRCVLPVDRIDDAG